MIKVEHYIVVNPEDGGWVYLTPGELYMKECVDDLPELAYSSAMTCKWDGWPIIGVTTNSAFGVTYSTEPMVVLRSSFPLKEEKLIRPTVKVSVVNKTALALDELGRDLMKQAKEKVAIDIRYRVPVKLRQVNCRCSIKALPGAAKCIRSPGAMARELIWDTVKNWSGVPKSVSSPAMVQITNPDGKGGYIIPEDIAEELEKRLSKSPKVKAEMVALDKESRYMQVQFTVGGHEIEQIDQDDPIGIIDDPIDPEVEKVKRWCAGTFAAQAGARLREAMLRMEKDFVEGTSEMEGEPVGILNSPMLGVFQKQIKVHDGTLSVKKDISEREASKYMNDAVRRELKAGNVNGDKIETQYSVFTWKADKK